MAGGTGAREPANVTDTANANVTDAAHAVNAANARKSGSAAKVTNAAKAAQAADTADFVNGEHPDKGGQPGNPGAPGSAVRPQAAVRAEAGGSAVDGREPGASTGQRYGRFPSLTQDTARPEGGGRAAGARAPAPARQWPLLSVLMGVCVGLLITLADIRAGTITIGLALLAGAALRWLLPSVGMLAVRSRFTDLVTYGVLGSAVVLLAMMAQPEPWLEIPFLADLLHFSVR